MCRRPPASVPLALPQYLPFGPRRGRSHPWFASGKKVSPEGVSELVAGIKKLKGEFHALIEEPIAMPRNGRTMGAASMLSYGRGVGIWEGALSTAGSQVDTVCPCVWKRKMFPKNGSDKTHSLKIAKKLFPDIRQKLNKSKYHGRAEALLIAHYLLTLNWGKGGKFENQKIY